MSEQTPNPAGWRKISCLLSAFLKRCTAVAHRIHVHGLTQDHTAAKNQSEQKRNKGQRLLNVTFQHNGLLIQDNFQKAKSHFTFSSPVVHQSTSQHLIFQWNLPSRILGFSCISGRDKLCCSPPAGGWYRCQSGTWAAHCSQAPASIQFPLADLRSTHLIEQKPRDVPPLGSYLYGLWSNWCCHF